MTTVPRIGDVVGDGGHVQLENTISIDIGGTFTDCLVRYGGRTASGKAPTTRHRLATGFYNAIRDCAEKLGVDAPRLIGETDIVRYATTLAMNALIERKGPRLGLITTAGFEDTTFIGRGALWHDGLPVEAKRLIARGRRPEQIIPRHMVVGIGERIDDDGRVFIPLDPDEVRLKVRNLVDRGAMGFVVALMQSHRNPQHERDVRDLIVEEFPDVYLGSQPILLSSEVLSKQNEYQRDMTSILAAYLHRTMAEELTELGNELRQHGYRRPLFIVNSQGGASPLQRTSAVETYNAGPVAGVIGGAHVASQYGFDNIILTDMGGTSFDIGTVVGASEPGDDSRHFYSHIPLIDRFRVGISMIETKSIGAGGGSIARFNDLLDVIEVGPESAGSNPGPAAFDFGGERPTVTDADVVLGYINPDYFLGGHMGLNPEAAHDAIDAHLAKPLGVTVEEAAYLVKTIVDANMGNEVYKETNLKGYDPREFTLFAFGGAGPTHAGGFGTYVQAPRIMVFPFSSVFSAYGVANTDFTRSYERGCSVTLYDATSDVWLDDFEQFNSVVHGVQEEALRDAADLGIANVIWNLDLFLRYGLQPHVTRIASPRVLVQSAEDVREVYAAFEREYARVYSAGATFLAGGVEITGMTLRSTVRAQKLEFPTHALEGEDASAARKGSRPTFWGPEHGWLDSGVYDFETMKPGNAVHGPAVLETPDTTIVVDPWSELRIDQHSNGIIERR